MQDLTRRTLAFWAVAEGVYALVVAFAVSVLVPWKTPWANALGLAYAALALAAVPGLARRRRWGWRLAVTGGIVGWTACVGVVGGLVASWAYLRSVYGDFGVGASIGALLAASGALQVLGLYPALKLCALLRREVRRDLGAGRGWVRFLVGISLVPLAVVLAVPLRFAPRPLAPVPPDARQQALDHLRAALEGRVRPETPALEGIPRGPGPLVVTAWERGRPALRVTSDQGDLAEAVRASADEIASSGPRPEARLQVDRVTALAPVASAADPVLALSVNPGVEGLWRQDRDPDLLVLPTDLLKKQVFGKTPLIPDIRELRLGMDVARARAAAHLEPRDRPIRVRTETWVEWEGQALPVTRGNTPLPASPGRVARWSQAAREGGAWLLQHQAEDGRFRYLYHPLSRLRDGRNRKVREYSVARHAGVVWVLGLLYEATGDPRCLAGARAGAAWLEAAMRTPCGPLGGACIASKPEVSFGTNAIAAVALIETYALAPDPELRTTVEGLLGLLMALQREDGEFHHGYDRTTGAIDPTARAMFASEEAALALVLAHRVLEEERYRVAARRALDHLTGPKYSDFLGHFIYGADVWTCLAAEEAYPRLQDPGWLDFCEGYARFLGRLQYEPGAWDNADFAGHYGFGALLFPQAPAAGGFGEAVTATAILARRTGQPAPELERQATLALDALVREQIRPDNAWMMPEPLLARGAVRRSPVEQEVRMDFVQHAVSALLRGIQLVGSVPEA
ncbi:MAG: hypothetical protein JXB39_12110 [Deltaproteobacteria bacterium]|nr:hypothetical protein [Deltaproteobacteria bacterium]